MVRPIHRMMWGFRDWLSKIQLTTLATAALSELLLMLGVITPSWQVAEDTDVGRSIASGLWIYCPGSTLQCWYIFSDDVVNIYERADVCRFLLIGDCRKKLLRTPYFFGWHYAVLTIMLIVLGLGFIGIAALALGYIQSSRLKMTTVIYDCVQSLNALLLIVGLVVFVGNAEMLESRYLIGIKNTFEKHYGYSFYLACLALLLMLFSIMIAIFLTTVVFFMPPQEESNIDYGIDREFAEERARDFLPQLPPEEYTKATGDEFYGRGSKMLQLGETSFDPVFPPANTQQQRVLQSRIEHFSENDAPRYCHSPYHH